MLNKRILGILICTASLSACSAYNPNGYTNYNAYSDEGTILYPETLGESYQSALPPQRKEVLVPETYHVSAYHSPASFKDTERTWAQSQNPQGYTIELADGEKPAQVAGTLSKAPKTNHMAEIKYGRDGKDHYKGLYGSYPTLEAAQKALNELPADVKGQASIKTWSAVQGSINQ